MRNSIQLLKRRNIEINCTYVNLGLFLLFLCNLSSSQNHFIRFCGSLFVPCCFPTAKQGRCFFDKWDHVYCRQCQGSVDRSIGRWSVDTQSTQQWSTVGRQSVHRQPNLRSGVIFFLLLWLEREKNNVLLPKTDYRDKGRGHDRRLQAAQTLWEFVGL